MAAPVLSVVVSTYNRADLLPDCLRSLLNQSLHNDRYEVLVIDNNSTDSTPVVAESFVRNYPNIRLILETKQGLACARNRGWREAKGDYVAYIDDDARATADWVSAICDFIERMPDIEAFGGPYTALYASPKPKWYKDEYGSWSLGESERPLCDNEFLNGTNMIFKRSIFAEAGGFAENLGMVGTTISYGEETNFDRRLKAAGKTIYYVPTIVVGHLVLPHKMSLGWMLASGFRNGLAGPITFQLERNIARALLRVLAACAIGAKRALFARETYLQSRIYEALRGVVWQAGVLVAMIRHRPDDPKTAP